MFRNNDIPNEEEKQRFVEHQEHKKKARALTKLMEVQITNLLLQCLITKKCFKHHMESFIISIIREEIKCFQFHHLQRQ